MALPIYSMNQNDDFYNQDLSQYLQNVLGSDGWVPPSMTTDQINEVLESMPNGTIWHDSSINSLATKQDGSLKKIVTEDY